MSMSVLSARMYMHCVLPNAHGGQKRAPDPLELELQMLISPDVGARN